MSDVFGKKIGQYILLDQLGEGGMAKVYNAFDTRIERNVAIKIILPSKQNSQIFLDQFFLEGKALAKLTHTNIVKVLDYGVEEGQPFLVMEFIQGGTLKGALSEPLPWQKAAEVLEPIARALDYVHRQQIVHRDIKPSNILLDKDYRPMLSDFGIVEIIENTEQSKGSAIGVGVGTPDYMSPEQATGKQTDFHSDIYSLGVMFYEMIMGVKPFSADTPMAIAIKHVTDEFPRPRKINKKVPAFVEAALLRSVQKDPTKRYASMAEFADTLALISLGERAPKRKIYKLIRQKKTAKKDRRFVLAIATVAIIGLTSYYIFSRKITTPVPVSSIASETQTQTTEVFLETQATKITSPATLEPEKVASPPPVPYQKNKSGLALVDSPIVYPVSGIREIARWGVGQVNDMEWSIDGQSIIIGATSGIFVYSSFDQTLELFIDPGFLPVEIAISPDGRNIAAGSIDGKVMTWDLQTGEFIREYIFSKPDSERVIDVHSRITGISYSPNGMSIAIGYDNGVINYFSADKNGPSVVLEQIPSVQDIAVSADGRFLYVANGEKDILVWDIATKKIVSRFSNPTPINKFILSSDRLLMLGGGSAYSVYLWDLSLERTVASFPYLESSISAFDFSRDDKFVVIGLEIGKIKMFQTPASDQYSNVTDALFTLEGTEKNQVIKFSPIEDMYFVNYDDATMVVLNSKNGEELFSLEGSLGKLDRIFLSTNGQWLASSHINNRVRVWNVDSSQEIYTIEGYLPKGMPFSPDNQYLAIIQKPDKQWDPDIIKILDLSNGGIVASLPGYFPDALVQFSEDSKLLFMGNPYDAIIWDVTTWEKINMRGGSNAGCGQYSTPQNQRLVIISDAGMIFDYNDYVKTLCGTKPVGATLVYYFPQQKRAIFVLGDGRILNWFFNQVALHRINLTSAYPLPYSIFLAGDQTLGLYAGRSGNSLVVYQSNGTKMLSIDGQDNYQYQVAFAQKKNILLALGSEFGSIHIWVVN